MTDSIETFGPPLRFVYEVEGDLKMVKFDDETISSLTKSSSSPVEPISDTANS